MFNFTSNKIENKFINILNAGWIGNELYTTMTGQRAWKFTSEDDGFIVTASYNKKTGKLTSLNGSTDAVMKFISDTEESDAAQAYVEAMVRRRWAESNTTSRAVKIYHY
jgi:hypothetical protein